jgi:hypothetical protein
MRRRLFGALGPILGVAVGCGLTTLETSELEQHAADKDPQLIINPSPIIITGIQGSASFAPYEITVSGGAGSGSGSAFLSEMHLMDEAFSSTDPTCSGGTALCTFPLMTVPLPTTMAALHCTPGAVPVVSTMAISASNGLIQTAEIQCGAGSGAGGFSVQGEVGRFFTPVGTPLGSDLVITSTDMVSAQEISLTVNGAFANEWSFDPACVSPQTCTLGAAGQLSIAFSFTPTAHGTRDADVTVSSSAPGSPPQTVDLLGTGEGAVLRIDDPSPVLEHDFGTIAKGQTARFSIQMTNLGNVDASVDLMTTLDEPFGVDATTPLPVTVTGNSGMGAIDVTCLSNTAMPQQMTTATLVPANTYQTIPPAPLSVALRCTIADTTLQVTPTPLDFEELRVGDAAGTIQVTIANPPVPAGNITITRIALANAPGALSLSAPPPQVLADGQSIMATLTLATTAEVTPADLATTALEIDVTEGASSETLVLPISGRVGRPLAVVNPSTLDLGTVCIGRGVEGQVVMTNTGTATLLVQPPEMEGDALVPLFTNPTEYPPDGATLLPGDDATVGVRPQTNTAAGLFTGTLRWTVDVPDTFQIPVTMELLSEGTAVSPARLVYGSVAIIDPPLNQQTITLENCGPGTAFVQYSGVLATAGRANAWRLDPPEQARELFPEETMRVRVSFQPREPGRHEATLEIDIGGGMKRTIALEGDATGVLPEQTSFYACDCSGGSGPGRWTSWLVPLACLLVLRRRRRVLRNRAC